MTWKRILSCGSDLPFLHAGTADLQEKHAYLSATVAIQIVQTRICLFKFPIRRFGVPAESCRGRASFMIYIYSHNPASSGTGGGLPGR